jgi:endonuclease/exonuclease/phosphatase family metal-dependent hydrolase
MFANFIRINRFFPDDLHNLPIFWFLQIEVAKHFIYKPFLMKFLPFLSLLFIPIYSFAQVITIDAKFDDWSNIPVQTDPTGDATNLDLLEFSVTNDADYLYLRIKTAEEFGLLNPPYTNSQVHLYIDTDNNPATGRSGNALGSEVRVLFGDKSIDFDYPQVGAYSGSLYDVGFLGGPTVTGTEFEIAIRRNAKPDGGNDLFRSDTVNLHFWSSGGDFMPDVNTSFNYTFDAGPFPTYPGIDIIKSDPQHLRIMAYNVLRGGLIDPIRGDSHERIVNAIEPQIIGFTEAYGSASDVKKLLDVWHPISGGWYTDLIRTNLIASQFPILFTEAVYPGDNRAIAAFIDLPDNTYATDILVITAHPTCCSNDVDRQDQIDRIASYILDAKSPGGRVNIPPNSPIAIIGDFNLVGWRQQLETIVKGDIVNTGTYGPGSPLDWDGSDMEDASCLHTHRPAFFTWRSPTSIFGPGKLDYIFYSGSEMEEMKSFTLDTDEMPAATLTQFGLNRNDTDIASDHLPLVADFKLEKATAIDDPLADLRIYPNPAGDLLHIQNGSLFPTTGEIHDLNGKLLVRFEVSDSRYLLDISALSTGVYVLTLTQNGQVSHHKLLKK